MVIYEDTRQQKGKHTNKNLWWTAHGVKVRRKKLDFGDYQCDASNISIDTKKGLREICFNVGKEHDRFVREIKRAQDAGYLLIFLIEQPGPIQCVGDVHTWINDTCQRCTYIKHMYCDSVATKCIKYRHRPMTGSTLQKILESMQISYGCRFELVEPENSARRICELLGVHVE